MKIFCFCIDWTAVHVVGLRFAGETSRQIRQQGYDRGCWQFCAGRLWALPLSFTRSRGRSTSVRSPGRRRSCIRKTSTVRLGTIHPWRYTDVGRWEGHFDRLFRQCGEFGRGGGRSQRRRVHGDAAAERQAGCHGSFRLRLVATHGRNNFSQCSEFGHSKFLLQTPGRKLLIRHKTKLHVSVLLEHR